jgi:hypothetical protein
MSDLQDLLSRLAHMPKRATTYLGKAIGKDDDRLHLAIETGVIAIPIGAITDVKHLRNGVENAVSVEVSDASGVTQILKVSPVQPGNPPLGYGKTWTPEGSETGTAAVPDHGGFILAADDSHNGQAFDDVIYQ